MWIFFLFMPGLIITSLQMPKASQESSLPFMIILIPSFAPQTTETHLQKGKENLKGH